MEVYGNHGLAQLMAKEHSIVMELTLNFQDMPVALFIPLQKMIALVIIQPQILMALQI